MTSDVCMNEKISDYFVLLFLYASSISPYLVLALFPGSLVLMSAPFLLVTLSTVFVVRDYSKREYVSTHVFIAHVVFWFPYAKVVGWTLLMIVLPYHP